MILALAVTLASAAALSFQPKTDAVVGVTAIHLQSGKSVSLRGRESFPMASVFKFPVALAVLRRVDTGTMSLKQPVTIEPKDFSPGVSPLRHRAKGKAIHTTVGEMLELMVRESDNTAADTLMKMVGGPTGVTLRLRELGAGGVRVDRSEKQIAADLRKPGGVDAFAIDIRDTSTPDSMAELLVTFWQRRAGLSGASHKMLARWMQEMTRGRRRITAGAPKGSLVTHRTGMMPGTLNDVGIVELPNGDHIAIAVFTKKGTASVEAREDDIAAATRAALNALR